MENTFSFRYKYTIGVDFALKVVELDSKTTVRLQLWDIAGQERFGVMTRVYYKEGAACVIVFDVTERRTFEAALKWKADLDSKVHLPNGDPVPCILVANKCDLEPRPIPREEIDAFVADNGFVAWFEVSAKDAINVDKAMNFLIHRVLNSNPGISAEDDDAFRIGDDSSLAGASSAGPSKKKCC